MKMAGRGRDDLERQPSYGSDEYPEGLPGTTPPDTTRFMKTLRLKDKKAGHTRKSSPNEAKRLSREMKQERSLYSPTREEREFGADATIVLENPKTEFDDDSGKIKLDAAAEVVTPLRSSSKEKACKKRFSVPADSSQPQPDDLEADSTLQRRGTCTTGSTSSHAHGGRRKSKSKDKKTAKQREQQRELKRESFEAAERNPASQNIDILNTLSPVTDRKKKLERSESFDENMKKGYLADEHESGEEDEMMHSLQPGGLQGERKPRNRLTHRATTVNFDENPQFGRSGQQKKFKILRSHSKVARSLPKERKEYFESIRWAVVKYGLGLATHRSVPPRQPPLGRHYSEGSIREKRLALDVWLRVVCYLQGHAGSPEEQKIFSDHLLQKRFEVKNTLRAITNFRMSEGGPFDPDSRSLSASFRSGYQEIPGDSDPTPEQSLDPSSMSTIVGDPTEGDVGQYIEDGKDKTRESSLGGNSSVPVPSGDSNLPQTDDPDTYLPVGNSLSKTQVSALKKVTFLLNQLEEALSLYPSSAKLAEEHAEYRNPNFQRKLEALLLWSKVTSGIDQRLTQLSKWFGVPILPPSDKDLSSSFQSDVGLQHQPVSVGSTTATHALTPTVSEHQPICVSPMSVVRVGRYHKFVVHGLKKGIKRMMENINTFIDPTLKLALAVFKNQDTRSDMASNIEERTPIHPGRHSSSDFTTEDSLSENVNWCAEFEDMHLPMFNDQFLLLARVPLDVMHECLRLQQYLKPPKAPSEFSISRLVSECRETIDWALKVHDSFLDQLHQAQGENLLSGNLPTEVEPFKKELAKVFALYLEYIQEWIKLSDPYQALTREWPIVKNFCKKMHQHESKGVKKICVMVSDLLLRLEEEMGEKVDEYLDKLLNLDMDVVRQRKHLSEATRDFKVWLTKVKEKSSKSLGVARMILKDLEVAADLYTERSRKELFRYLQASDHVEVAIAGKMDREKMIFAPRRFSAFSEEIVDLLTLSCGRSETHQYYSKHRDHMYILILHIDPEDCHHDVWHGETVNIELRIEAILSVAKLEVEDIKLVAWNSGCLDRCWREVNRALGPAIVTKNLHTSNQQEIAIQLEDIREKSVKLSETILNLYKRIKDPWTDIWELLGDDDLSDTLSYRTMVNVYFNLGFENSRDVIRLLGEAVAYSKLGLSFKDYAIQWIQFITDKYKSKAPGQRYTLTGLDFLMIGCHTRVLSQLSEEDFAELKDHTNRCFGLMAGDSTRKPHVRKISTGYASLFGSPLPGRRSKPPSLTHSMPPRAHTDHLEVGYWAQEDLLDGKVLPPPSGNSVGIDPTDEEYDEMYPPLPSSHHKPPSSTDSSTSSGVVKDDESPPLTLYPDAETPFVMTVAHPTSIEHIFSFPGSDGSGTSNIQQVATPDEMTKITEIRLAAKKCDEERNTKLFESRIIGRERPDYQPANRNLDTLRQVGFTWIRGIMIGKGSSGKVYQCLHAKTGETMAVKQIPMELNNTPKAIKRLVDEIGHLQDLTHPNIIQYFGVEIHRSELFLFMEYCSEGDIWTLSKQGLDEYMIRHYTNEALQGLIYIHSRGIVHRDIKGANMFIASNGHLKLGDFGLSFQLHNISHTRRDEICENVGTVAYMAPEVIKGGKQHRIGRGSDIWSLGCTVIEMITGKSPWNELDNEYRIMFAVGNGRSPTIPDSVDDEGREFLEACFQVDPEERWTANKLINHPFVKVEQTMNGALYS